MSLTCIHDHTKIIDNHNSVNPHAYKPTLKMISLSWTCPQTAAAGGNDHIIIIYKPVTLVYKSQDFFLKKKSQDLGGIQPSAKGDSMSPLGCSSENFVFKILLYKV